ncbi:MAG: sigma 54-interacting transcriptional regulator [Fibrobacterota bacterium]
MDNTLKFHSTKNSLMKQVYRRIHASAPYNTTILLMGETGTGKTELARYIHSLSKSKNGPFLTLHCGSIPETLIESELFGHEKGAFTGAIKKTKGKFEQAANGTLFLDEIGTMSPQAQVRLLRVLQNGTFQRVGGDSELKSGARIIAAGNSDFDELCESGLFRKDLYYRISAYPIILPPLRERSEDIKPLSLSILNGLNMGNHSSKFFSGDEVFKLLIQYSWPGNIRELENLIERAYINTDSECIKPDSFTEITGFESFKTASPGATCEGTLRECRETGIKTLESEYLTQILKINEGRIKESSASAGISTRQLSKLLRRHGISKEMFKFQNRSGTTGSFFCGRQEL